MIVKHNGWIVEIPDNGNDYYVYVARANQPGNVHIKAESDGWVVDLWPQSYSETHSSAFGLYSDLDDAEEDES